MISQEELIGLAMTLQQMGAEVHVDADELAAYYPDIDNKSFYLPTHIPKNFYYDAAGLRKLTTIDSNVFRRLVGA